MVPYTLFIWLQIYWFKKLLISGWSYKKRIQYFWYLLFIKCNWSIFWWLRFDFYSHNLFLTWIISTFIIRRFYSFMWQRRHLLKLLFFIILVLLSQYSSTFKTKIYLIIVKVIMNTLFLWRRYLQYVWKFWYLWFLLIWHFFKN